MKKYFIIALLISLASSSKGQYAVNITRSDSATYTFYTSLLDQVKEPQNVDVLYLNDSKLKVIPKNIGKLNNLTSLYLSNNKLGNLPRPIYYLHKLEVLDLRNNDFNELSKEIENLKNLKRLDLRGNNINHIPDQIKHLKLKWLYLGPAELFDEDEKIRIRKLLPNTIVFFEKTTPTELPFSSETHSAFFQEEYLAPNNAFTSSKKIITLTEPIKVYYQAIVSCKR